MDAQAGSRMITGTQTEHQTADHLSLFVTIVLGAGSTNGGNSAR
jgi:hypothetical protein